MKDCQGFFNAILIRINEKTPEKVADTLLSGVFLF